MRWPKPHAVPSIVQAQLPYNVRMLKEFLNKVFVNFGIEAPARRRSLAQFAARFEQRAKELAVRFAKAPDTDKNRDRLGHIIGIERWGQRRLKVALGEEFVQDEYNGYRPDHTASWADLLAQWQATRTETTALVRTFATQNTDVAQTIPHNSFGPLTVKGWLQYLSNHATRESFGVR